MNSKYDYIAFDNLLSTTMSRYAYDDGHNLAEEFDQEIDHNIIRNRIISKMHHLIFCDLTVGRSDRWLEPYDSASVSRFINDNSSAIELAAATMFSAYEEEDDLRALMTEDPPMDWFSEFLYEFVNTGASSEHSDDEDFREDVDEEYRGEEDDEDRDED